MKVKVTARGVMIPRRMLGGATEVELRQEVDRIVVFPVGEKQAPEDEPLYELGSDPVDMGVTDGSVNHDHYLYEDRG